jgi:hypothetical protein
MKPIEFREAIRRLQRTPNSKAYWSFALSAVKQGLASKAQTRKAIAECLRTLEAFVVRKGLNDGQVTGMQILLKDLWSEVESDNKALRSAIFALGKHRGPDNDELRGTLESLTQSFYPSELTHYVLAIRERALRAPSKDAAARNEPPTDGTGAAPRASFAAVGVRTEFTSGVTASIDIDHIFPQTPKEAWGLPTESDENNEEYLSIDGFPFSDVVHCLGNLVLLEQELNRKRDNSHVIPPDPPGDISYDKDLKSTYTASSFADEEELRDQIVNNFDNGVLPWSSEDMQGRASDIAHWICSDGEGWQQPWD